MSPGHLAILHGGVSAFHPAASALTLPLPASLPQSGGCSLGWKKTKEILPLKRDPAKWLGKAQGKTRNFEPWGPYCTSCSFYYVLLLNWRQGRITHRDAKSQLSEPPSLEALVAIPHSWSEGIGVRNGYGCVMGKKSLAADVTRDQSSSIVSETITWAVSKHVKTRLKRITCHKS